MFVAKAGAYPFEETFRCPILEQAPGLAYKQQTRLERLARDKHFSSLRKLKNHGNKKFSTLAPGFTRKYQTSLKTCMGNTLQLIYLRRKRLYNIGTRWRKASKVIQKLFDSNDKLKPGHVLYSSDKGSVIFRIVNGPNKLN